MNKIDQILLKNEVIFADGATGTNLFEKGLETGYPPELWNVEHPKQIKSVHCEFIKAGSDMILTNSFGGTSFRLKLHQSENRVAELNSTAAQLARQAADEADKPVIVAGSVGPTGELFSPLGALNHEMAVAAFKEQCMALREGGVDAIWIETMSSIEEFQSALEAALMTGLPVCATMTFDTSARSMMGVKPEQFAKIAHSSDLSCYGANCGVGPAELMHSISQFDGYTEGKLIIAKSNCGIPTYDNGQIRYKGTPELMADYAVLARDLGVKIIGGCCGTTPIHIKAMAQAVQNRPKEAFTQERADDLLGLAWEGVNLNYNSPEISAGRTRSKRRRN